MENNLEKSLKRFLKRRVKVTLGMMVAFMITGMISYSNEGQINETVIIKNDSTGNLVAAVGENETTIENNTWTNNGMISGKEGVIVEPNVDLNIINNGIILGKSNENRIGNGIYNKDNIKEIENSGIISGENQNGVRAGNGICNEANIENIRNQGIILGNGKNINSGNGILDDGSIINIVNNGVVLSLGSGNAISVSKIEKILNKGITVSVIEDKYVIMNMGNGIANINADNILEEVINEGIILGSSEGTKSDTGNGIFNANNANIKNIKNYGIILGSSGKTKSDTGNGILNYGIDTQIDNLKNYGIIAGSNKAVADNGAGVIQTNPENYGLLINGAGTNNVKVNAGAGGEINIALDGEPEDKRFIINTVSETPLNGNEEQYIDLSETTITSEKISEKIGTDSNYITENGYKNLILNGYGTTLSINGDLSLDNSIINGGLDGEVNETGKIINASATISGSTEKDNLTLTGNSIINGNIDLGAENDNLTIADTVQLNGDLLGGNGDLDNLIFNSSITKSNENSINIFHSIKSFENINIGTNVTLFESAEVTGAKNIIIQENGNLVLRIDGTEKNSNNQIIGHALSGNTGTISSNSGKLLLALNGVGEGEIISFEETKLDETIKGNEDGIREEITLDSTSILHNIEKINNNSVKVTTVSDIPYVNDINYNELNKIYKSIREINQVKEFDVTDDKKLFGLINYLDDIYAGTPYSFSSQLSRKSANMFGDIVMDKDLHPEVNKWTIYGGLTHIDGGIKETYYGKGYYTYDVGGKDIDVDSKITGMYVQGEYGVNEALNTGLIFGGNQSESEINRNSKVEGDSFYLGAYAKKYLGNLRLLAGLGYQYGDYKTNRVAVGYDGITTTRTYDSNYNDNTLNIYAQAKYSNKLAENLYLEPSVALDYTYINQDEASEDGVLAIEKDDKDFNYTTAKFGVDLRKDIPTASATHSLIAGAYYNRMLDGYEGENITGRFVGGSDFDILVSPSNKHELGLRAKYEVELNNGVTFDVKGSYTFERESYSGENKNKHEGEWLVGVGIGYKF